MQPVELTKAFRLLNHGPTTIITSAHAGKQNIMAAAWVCALDFNPPKVTVVIDSKTYTRELMEAEGSFAINLPCVKQIEMVKKLEVLAVVICRAQTNLLNTA